MADIHYDSNQVESHMSSISSSLKKMNNSLQKIQEGLQNTMMDKSNWDSIAGDYFSSKCRELFSSIVDFGDLGKNIDDYMNTVKSNYRATTEKTTNLFQNLLSKLGGK
ncbi:MAG: hypothetical protein IJ743_04305 [Bacilli bacterium]|nr:hypothetical protein [Bacilli bacterium]